MAPAPHTRLASLARHLQCPVAVAAQAAGVSIDLTGKVAVVTGATGQLGRTMVRTLGRAGADVAVHYRSDKAGAEALCAELSDMGRRSVAVFADVGDKQSVDTMQRQIERA